MRVRVRRSALMKVSQHPVSLIQCGPSSQFHFELVSRDCQPHSDLSSLFLSLSVSLSLPHFDFLPKSPSIWQGNLDQSGLPLNHSRRDDEKTEKRKLRTTVRINGQTLQRFYLREKVCLQRAKGCISERLKQERFKGFY